MPAFDVVVLPCQVQLLLLYLLHYNAGASVIGPKNIPAVCFCHVGFSSAVLYVGSEFKTIGILSGTQAVKILKQGVKPETLPVLIQDDLKILVDLKTTKKLGIELPMGILQIAKSVDTEKK